MKKQDNYHFTIDSIWFKERETGICIFGECFNLITNEKKSIDLIYGFFSAISVFAEQLFDEDISFIEMSRRKFYFKKSPNFVFIISVSIKGLISNKKIKYLINFISKEFTTQYNSDFEK
jgi:hypothetical protein